MKYINKNWQQQPTTNLLAFQLRLTVKHLIFGVQVAGPEVDYDRSIPEGQFTAGLWQRDVAELFLYDQASNIYQEINLAPSGAWWSAAFSAPRQQTSFIGSHLEVQVEVKRSTSAWQAEICLNRDQLPIQTSPGTSRANVAFVRRESGVQQFYSFSRLLGDTPDFHQPQAFPPLEDILTSVSPGGQ